MVDDAAARVAQIRRLWQGARPGRAGPTRDIHDLLDALAAAEAERDMFRNYAVNAEEHFKVFPGQATAADVLDAYPCASPTCPAEQCILGRQIKVLETAQAQAAPLLAAVGELAVLWDSDPKLWAWDEIEALVLAWRAAREG